MPFIKSKLKNNPKEESKKVEVNEISFSSNSRNRCNNLKFLTSDLSLFLKQTPLEIVNDYQIVDENLDITLNIYRSSEVINKKESHKELSNEEISQGIPSIISRNFKNGLLNFNYSPPSVHYYSIYTESIQKVILNTSKGNNLIFIYLQEVIEEEKEKEKEIRSKEERNSKRLKASNVTKDLFKWNRKEIEKISRLY